MASHRDGTISLFTTMIDADSPACAPDNDLTPVGMAPLYREVAFNDLTFINRGPELEEVQRLRAETLGWRCGDGEDKSHALFTRSR